MTGKCVVLIGENRILLNSAKNRHPKPTEQQKREDSYHNESSLSFCLISDMLALVSVLFYSPAKLAKQYNCAEGTIELAVRRIELRDTPKRVGRRLAPAEMFGEDMESSPTGRKVSRTP